MHYITYMTEISKEAQAMLDKIAEENAAEAEIIRRIVQAQGPDDK